MNGRIFYDGIGGNAVYYLDGVGGLPLMWGDDIGNAPRAFGNAGEDIGDILEA